jgi:hypothetical protein
VDPYRQGMARPQVVDGEDGVKANVRNSPREQPIREVVQLGV